MKRNLVLLAIAGLLVAFAAGLWATRSNEADEAAPDAEESALAGTSQGIDAFGEGPGEAILAGPALEGELAFADETAPPARDAGLAVTQDSAGGSPNVAGASIDRKIIQTGSLTLRVEAVGEAFEEVGRIATAAGGFVASSTFTSTGGDNEGEEQVASVTIRVPATRYQDVLASLRGLAVKVEREESQASDITEEFSDLSARLRNLEATEVQYLEFLKQAKNIGEVFQVQDRLNAVRAEIERVRGRMNLLENLSDLATVTVHLRPEAAAAPISEPGGANPAHAAQEAWDASLEALLIIASGIVMVVVFSWWLVPPIGLLALVLWQTVFRQRKAEVT